MLQVQIIIVLFRVLHFLEQHKMNQEIIHKIRWVQQIEGHRPCFRSGKIVCRYEDRCCWAEICDNKDKHIKPLIKYEVIE